MIERFLKYGDSAPFLYRESIPSKNIGWYDAKDRFYELLKTELEKFNSSNLSFCGTYGGYALLKILGNSIPTWSTDIGFPLHIFTKEIGSNHFYGKINIDNLENELLSINQLWDTPRCSVEDIYAFARQRAMKEGSVNRVYCEGGTDWLLFGNANIYLPVMKLALKRKEYSLVRASNYISRIEDMDLMTEYSETYLDAFFKNQCLFIDEEIKDLGYAPPSDQLRNEMIEDFTMAVFDWGYQSVYLRRTKVLGDYFGLEIFSPFLNSPEFVNFCLSLPFEMKFCLGRGKHILKETIPIYHSVIPSFTSSILRTVIKPARELSQKYIPSIYKYLDKQKIDKYLEDDYKYWFLLNLGIWLEIHGK